MSTNIEKVFQDAYDAEVKRAYGQVGELQGTVYTKTGVVGKSVYFRKKGKGLAKRHTAFADRIAMDVDFNQVKCDLQDWEAFDYVDKMSMKKINFGEIKELAEVAGDALGLRKDQIIIDAIKDGYDQENMKFGTSGAALTVDALIEATTALDDKGVPSNERTGLFSAKQKGDLLKTTQVTSSDYNGVKALVNGEVNTFLGVKWIVIASREEGGLPTSGNDVIGFIYHKRAVGFALGQEIQTEMSWLADRGAWIVGGDFSAGAVVIDQDGIAAFQSAKAA
jgi:hypothetical protein